MASAVQKIKLSPSRDIPFNKLVLSQSNVRRVKAGVSIEQLAESIAERTLQQSLSVRSVVNADGQETGMFEVPAGGRRYRALERLVKQKRMAKTEPVPCVVRNGGTAEDDSFAENDQRIGLHPLDQFRAFQSLRDGGMSEEEISARHFVTPAIVKQRLRLASVSPKLHEVYAEDGMTLEQLMAFSVIAEHARQEQVWDSVSRSQLDEPLIERRNTMEYFRDQAADHFSRHTGSHWHPRSGSMVNHRALTSAVIDSRDFIAAKRRAETEVLLPAGPKLAFTGGLDFNDHHLIWDKLDQPTPSIRTWCCCTAVRRRAPSVSPPAVTTEMKRFS
jgi:ParB family chromosome partitioning protein